LAKEPCPNPSKIKAVEGRGKLTAGGYSIDILIQGFPGRSGYHGYLGWSTVALLRGHGQVILLDAGPMGMRRVLTERLAEHGLNPGDVTDLVLTHSHFDHAINWTLFPKSRIAIGDIELRWAETQPWGETPVPELYVKELRKWPTLVTVNDGDEVLPGLTARLAPGHTPGCLVYVLRGENYDVIFTGDAVKNRAELLSGTADMSYDAKASASTIATIWDLWRSRPATVLIPGHDIPMRQKNGKPHYLDRRRADVRAWFGRDMETMTIFELTDD
jgi:glyoxylase-like metal-dependent hydrolase (beta-lactamase superfamily II)